MPLIGQLIRFGGVGGLATLVHVLVASAAQASLSVPAQAANLLGFSAAVLLSYLGHARITFDVTTQSGAQFLRFLYVSLLGLGASSLTVWIVNTLLGLSFTAAMATVVVTVPAVTYVSMRFWVFADQDDAILARISEPSLCAGIALAMLAVFWDRLVNHDIAWYLFATRDWLAGAELHIDLIEVNPPLNFYLTVPALVIADFFGISDQHGHYAAISLLLFTSLLWSGAILRTDFSFSAERRALLLVGIGVAVILPSLDGIGQREQIMVLCFLPWAFHEASERGGTTRQTIASAAFAAIGMCIKPHFVCLPLSVTLLNCMQARSIRPVFSPANFVFFGVGLAYVGYVWVAHPAYLFDIIPISLEVYGTFGASVVEVLWIIGYPMGLVALVIAVGWRRQTLSRSASLFLALAIGGLGSYFLQGTGFTYHKVPFLAFSMIACCLIMLQASRLRPDLIVAAIAWVGIAVAGFQLGFYRNAAIPEIMGIVSDVGELDALITLSSDMHTGPAVAMALGTDWASSYPANWLVPGAVNRLAEMDCNADANTCARLEAIAAKNRTANIHDVASKQPELLIVDLRLDDFDQPGFDWLAFMDADPDWAPVFAEYRQVAASDRFLYFLRTGN